MRGAVLVAIAASIGNLLQGWDNATIAGKLVLVTIVFGLFDSNSQLVFKKKLDVIQPFMAGIRSCSSFKHFKILKVGYPAEPFPVDNFSCSCCSCILEELYISRR